MSRHITSLPGALAPIATFIPSPASGQWVKDGAPVVSELFPQKNEVAVSDGNDGTFLVWVDISQSDPVAIDPGPWPANYRFVRGPRA